MSDRLPLAMLLDLARERCDEATRQLGQLNSVKLNADKQLSMLQDYRLDYLNRLQDAMVNGMPAADCHNYQRFINTLDEAIGQQNSAVAQADVQLQGGRVQWQQEKRKVNSFDALAQRELRARAIDEGRREQRTSDEYAARSSRHPTFAASR